MNCRPSGSSMYSRALVVWLVARLCPALCNPMDCSPPGSSVHGILQARTLEWVAMPSSRGSSQPRDGTCVSNTAARFFTTAPPGNPPCKQTAPRAFWGEQRRMRESWASLEGSGGPRDPGLRRNSLVCSFVWGHPFAQNHSWWEGAKAAGDTPAVQWVSHSPQSRRPDSLKC